MDYAALLERVTATLKRSDLASHVPGWMLAAEAHINRSVRTDDMVASRTWTQVGDALTLPDDWLETLSVTAGPDDRTVARVHRRDLNGGPARYGVPCRYTRIGRELQFDPRPADETPVTLTYMRAVPALSETSPTNWLLTRAPDVYLYSTLLHSAYFLMDDERIGIWGSLRATAIRELNDADARADFASDATLSPATAVI